MAKILVIDDSAHARESLSKSLSDVGHNVLSAADGASGLSTICATPDLELIITDFNMPIMDGLEMIRQARTRLGELKPKVFVLTAATSQAARTTGKELGVSAWIIKPFDTNKILGAITKILAK